MGSQHPLPANAPCAFESRYGPRDRLEQLHVDWREAKAELRDVLERLAERHGISQKDIIYAIDGYAELCLDAVDHLGDVQRGTRPPKYVVCHIHL